MRRRAYILKGWLSFSFLSPALMAAEPREEHDTQRIKPTRADSPLTLPDALLGRLRAMAPPGGENPAAPIIPEDPPKAALILEDKALSPKGPLTSAFAPLIDEEPTTAEMAAAYEQYPGLIRQYITQDKDVAYAQWDEIIPRPLKPHVGPDFAAGANLPSPSLETEENQWSNEMSPFFYPTDREKSSSLFVYLAEGFLKGTLGAAVGVTIGYGLTHALGLPNQIGKMGAALQDWLRGQEKIFQKHEDFPQVRQRLLRAGDRLARFLQQPKQIERALLTAAGVGGALLGLSFVRVEAKITKNMDLLLEPWELTHEEMGRQPIAIGVLSPKIYLWERYPGFIRRLFYAPYFIKRYFERS